MENTEILDKLLQYKQNNLTDEEMLSYFEDKVVEHGVRKLEKRFGFLENIGNMLSFTEVADAIYSKIPEKISIPRIEILKMLFQKEPKWDIDNMIEEAIGKIKTINDRKGLKTKKYEAVLQDDHEAGLFLGQLCYNLRDKIDDMEKYKNTVTIYSTSDIWDDIVKILEMHDIIANVEEK